MNDNTANYRDLRSEVQPFLRHGEELLWTGAPGKIPASQTSPVLPIFAVFWMGFAIFWTIGATAAGGVFGLFGIFFILFGGIMFYNMFFGRRNLLKNAVYAVTDRRAIIVTHDRHGTNCTEYVFSNLPCVNLESVNGNTGTIRFEEEHIYTEYHSGLSRRRSVTPDTVRKSAVSAFFMIDDVHRVYHLISDQLNRDTDHSF